MGIAIDTILGNKNAPGSSFAKISTSNSGDSLTIRDFPQTSAARLEQVIRRHASSGGVRILSPLLHDDVTGLTWYSDQTPSVHLLPPQVGQQVQRGDTLTVEVTGDTTDEAVVALTVYYDNLSGADAKLFSWGDVAGNIKNMKALEVDVTNSATVGEWEDTAVDTTDKQLHASSQYAVLGYVTDTALAVVGLKSQTTGNLRVSGPGSDSAEDTSYWFVQQSQREGTPHIPVFSALSQSAVYVSTADDAASTTPKITLVLAELEHAMPGV